MGHSAGTTVREENGSRRRTGRAGGGNGVGAVRETVSLRRAPEGGRASAWGSGEEMVAVGVGGGEAAAACSEMGGRGGRTGEGGGSVLGAGGKGRWEEHVAAKRQQDAAEVFWSPLLCCSGRAVFCSLRLFPAPSPPQCPRHCLGDTCPNVQVLASLSVCSSAPGLPALLSCLLCSDPAGPSSFPLTEHSHCLL